MVDAGENSETAPGGPWAGVNQVRWGPAADLEPVHSDLLSKPIPSAPEPQSMRPLVVCDVRLREMFRIHLVNYFLTLITLGFYRFWGKTRMRRYIWGHVAFDGTRFEYTGTAKELFIGFWLMLLGVIVPFFGAIWLLENVGDPLSASVTEILDGVELLGIVVLVTAGAYRARRYRLTRTRWRAIGGAQSGSTPTYVGLTFFGYFISGISATSLWPFVRTKVMGYKMRHTWLGNQKLGFEPSVGPLYKSLMLSFLWAVLMFAVLWALAFCGAYLLAKANMLARGDLDDSMAATAGYLVMGSGGLCAMVSWLWYKGRELSHFVNNTTFHGLRFHSTLGGWRMAWLGMGNLLISLLSLGLLSPLANRRILRAMEKHFTVSGEPDYAALTKSYFSRPEHGEGLADAFDVGAF